MTKRQKKIGGYIGEDGFLGMGSLTREQTGAAYQVRSLTKKRGLRKCLQLYSASCSKWEQRDRLSR